MNIMPKIKNAVSLLPLALITAAEVLYIVMMCRATLGYKIVLEGETLGVLESMGDAEFLITGIRNEIYGDSDFSEIALEPEISLCTVFGGRYTDAEEIKSRIAETAENEYAAAFKIMLDGKKVAFCESREIAEEITSGVFCELTDIIAGYEKDAEKIVITSNVEICSDVCKKSEILGRNETENAFSAATGLTSLKKLNRSGNVSAEEKKSGSQNEYYDEVDASEIFGDSKETDSGETASERVRNETEASSAAFGNIRIDSPYSGGNGYDAFSDPDIYSSKGSGNINSGLSGINVKYAVKKTETVSEVVRFSTEYIKDNEKFLGNFEQTQEGSDGLSELTYEITYTDGNETGRELINITEVSKATPSIFVIGTKAIPEAVPTGKYIWPVDDYTEITSFFADVRPLYDGSAYHFGIDIAGDRGDPIYASDGGTVIWAQLRSSYGLLVIIDNGNGYVSYYGHMSKILVSCGDKVYQGQQIGLMGRTGTATGEHLHFEIRYDNTPLDPLDFLPNRWLKS